MSAATNILKAGLRSPILSMVAKVYIPTLFPLTFLIALVSLWLDAQLGFGDGFLPSSANLIIAASSFVLGAILGLWTYEQLTPYFTCRHRGQLVVVEELGFGDLTFLAHDIATGVVSMEAEHERIRKRP